MKSHNLLSATGGSVNKNGTKRHIANKPKLIFLGFENRKYRYSELYSVCANRFTTAQSYTGTNKVVITEAVSRPIFQAYQDLECPQGGASGHRPAVGLQEI